MSDSGDPKLDKQRELEAEREHYEQATPPLQSSEWLDDWLNEFYEKSVDAYQAFMGTYTDAESDETAPDRLIAEAKVAINKKFEEAQVEARLNELKLLREDYDISMDFEPIDKRIAELDSLRPQIGGSHEKS